MSRTGMSGAQDLRLTTPRTLIDPICESDLPAIHAIVTEPGTARMLMRFHPGQSVADIARMLAVDITPHSRPLRLAVRFGGRCIGTIGVGAGATPDIFYGLASGMRGMGIGSEILPPFCAAMRSRFGLTTLRAMVFCDNPASRHVLEKAGFRVTGTRLMISAARPAPAEGWVMQAD